MPPTGISGVLAGPRHAPPVLAPPVQDGDLPPLKGSTGPLPMAAAAACSASSLWAWGGDGKPLSLLSLPTASTYSSALLPLSFWGAWCGQCLEGKARGLKMPGFVLITGDEAQGRRNGHRGLGQGLSLEIPRNRCSRQGHPGGTRVSHLGRGEGCCGQKGRNRLRWLGMPRICWFGECQWCLGALLRCLALGRIRAHGQRSRA